MSLADAARQGPPAKRIAAEARSARIFIYDIETKPSVVHAWSYRNVNVGLNQVVEPGGTICWAGKFYGEKAIEFRSDHHDGHDVMVRRAWENLNEADIVVGFNHRSFDNKHLNAEFVRLGLPKPSPWKDVDLLSVVRREFRFSSSKLDHVAGQLGLGNKVSHEGHGLWMKCLEGDAKAWERMKRYNVGDVRLTERLFDRLRPWLGGAVNMALYTDATQACPNCGSTDYDRDGYAYTAQTKYALHRCRKCLTPFRANYMKHRVDTRAVR